MFIFVCGLRFNLLFLSHNSWKKYFGIIYGLSLVLTLIKVTRVLLLFTCCVL